MFAKFVSLLLALGFILLLAGCAAKEQKIPEPVSGEYSVLKKSGEGYLSGVLKFDFENGGFMGGAASPPRGLGAARLPWRAAA